MNNKEKISPFTPGNPVPIELFVGRLDKIEEIVRYVEQSSSGRQESVFLLGDRGIGKSSMASFLRHFVTTKNNMLGIHVFLGGVSTLEEMVRRIVDQLLKEAQTQTWYDKIAQLFGNHIRQVGLFNISVTFAPPEKDLRELVNKFPEALDKLLQRLEEEKAGLFIALDDVDALVDNAEFANWYKSFADEIATHYKTFPVFLMLVGLPEKRDILASTQPSLMRIFKPVEIEKLSDREVEQFVSRAFGKTTVKVEAKAMEWMVKYSSGLPIMMHEIGDATFWTDTDGVIDEDDAVKGVLAAAQNVGRKYLDPKVYRAIRSQGYMAILRKLGKREISISRYFKKRELVAKLNASEKRVLTNFLRRMRELGVIEPDIEGGTGSYKFVNDIYPIYIWLEGTRFERTKGSK